MNFSDSEDQKKATVYKHYRAGLSVSTTIQRTGLSRKYITELYFDWDEQLSKVKKEVQNPTPFSKISEALNTNRGHGGDFILSITSNPEKQSEIINAYNKMINP